MSKPQPSSERLFLAQAIAWFHTGLVVFFALGWLLPWPSAWWTVLSGGVVMRVIWCVYQNNCPLTVLEAHLRSAKRISSPETAVADQEAPHFVAGLIAKITGRRVSRRAGDFVVHSVLYASMALCMWRLAS